MTNPMHDPDPIGPAPANGKPDPDWTERFYEGVTEYERVRVRRLRVFLCVLVIAAGVAAIVVGLA